MNDLPKILLAALGGGLLVAAIVWLPRGEPEVPPVRPESTPSTPATAPAASPAATDLSPVMARLDAVHERLRALEQRIESFAAAPLRTAAVDGVVPTTVAIDVDSLQRALEQIEQRKLDAKSDDELLRSARIAGKGGADVADAVRQLQALLQRPLTPERRAEVMVELGSLMRQQGTKESLAASAQTLQGVVDAQGIDSKTGRAAAYQLIWTCAEQKDTARGLAMAQAYSQAPNATAYQRIEGRWAAAILVHGAGDVARARGEYEALLRDLGDQPEYAKLAGDIRQRLAKL